MATRNIVPRANNEGNIGTNLLRWIKGWFGDIFVSGSITDGTNSATVANIKTAVDDMHLASGQFNQTVSGEISGLTNKATPVDNDVFLAENSANSYSKIKVLWSSIVTTLKTYFDTVYTLTNLGGVPTTRQVNGHALSADVTVTKSDVGLSVVTNDIQAKADFSGYTNKGTPIDGDSLIINDSASAGNIKKSLWSDIKGTLKSYFDTLYQPIGGFASYYAESLGESSTTSVYPTFINKVTLTCTPTAGTYILEYGAWVTNSNAVKNIWVRIIDPTSTFEVQIDNGTPYSGSGWVNVSDFKQLTLSNVSSTFTIDFCVPANAGYIKNAKISLRRIY